MKKESILELERFGVAFADHIVLESVNLTLTNAGVTVLVGPAGAGKSTLLRTLAGLNDPQPSLRMWGRVHIAGEPAEDALPPRHRRDAGHDPRRIGFVVQNTRFYMASVREILASALPDRALLSRAAQVEAARALLCQHSLSDLAEDLEMDVVALPLALQRRLAILRLAATPARLLLVDEPTAGLEPGDAGPVLELLRQLATARALLVVTHNQQHARALGGRTALLAGGQIQELGETGAFFDEAKTELGRVFVRTGGCVAPASGRSGPCPGGDPTTSAPSPALSRHDAPRGFHWLRPGAVGGCPRPGLLENLATDLDALCRLGVSKLVCLEETQTVAPSQLADRGLGSIHSPIVDMDAPGLEQAAALCEEITHGAARGEIFAVHCRAGLGRTGTLLACLLIHDGAGAPEALEALRHINPGWVQSRKQIQFLEEFAHARR